MTKQEKMEKVISDLEEQIVWIRDNDFHKFPGWGHAVLAMRDASALLKAQAPRVMTLEEVKSAWRNRDIAFLVEYNDGGNPVWMLYYGYLSTQEEIVLIDEIAHLRHFGIDGYGIDWRVWTSRPTDEQREAVKWE